MKSLLNKKSGTPLVSFFVFSSPLFAAGKSNFMQKLTDVVLTPLLGLLSMGAFVYFLFGIMVFFFDKDQSEEARTKLKKHMVWGLVGLFIIFSIGGIVNFISSFGMK